MDELAVAIHDDPTTTDAPQRGWWLSLYLRLSSRARRLLALACMATALLAHPWAGVHGQKTGGGDVAPAKTHGLPTAPSHDSAALGQSAEHAPDPHGKPAVQNAFRKLGLDAPVAPYSPAALDEVPGVQFDVNSYTTNFQEAPSVSLDADGDFVVVWQSTGSDNGDTSGDSIQGQRFNSAGAAQGSQFRVNAYTTSHQRRPFVSLDADGDFVVVWQSIGSDDGDTDGYSIQAQRFNSSGAAQGGQFQVNNLTTSNQQLARVSLDADGDFMVVWQGEADISSFSIQGRRYNSVGTAQGSEFEVNTETVGNQLNPSVSLDADGDFVVVWDSDFSNYGDNDHTVQGQRYNSAGAVQGSQFQVNTTYTFDVQNYPSVSLDADGDFVVVWQSIGSGGTDTSPSSYSIQGQRFNATGAVQGSQFQVNTYTTSHQRFPSVSLDSDGDFVVAWQSDGSDSTNTFFYSVQGRRFRRDGLALNGEFQVNTPSSHILRPSVALDANGDFLVAWEGYQSGGTDTSNSSIQAARFDLGQTGYQVNEYTTGNQRFPIVAVDAGGDFVVAWESNGSSGTDTDGYSIQGRRFNSVGEPLGGQFQVNTFTTSAQRYPSVALDADGDFVVVWQSAGSDDGDTSGYSIQGRRYNSAGAAQGGQFQVNAYSTSDQRFPIVALDADGDFVVVWQSAGSSGTDTSLESIQGRRYNSVGTAQGGQFQVNNTYTTSFQRVPTVALDADGDFVVAWGSDGSSIDDSSGESIQGQRYNSAGTAQGSEFQVNAYTTSHQRAPTVTRDAAGDFVVVWHSDGSGGDDTSGESIQGQRYDSVGAPQGGEFQVNTYTTSDQQRASVSSDTDGDFVVVWQSLGADGGDTSGESIQGQRYNSVGAVQGSQFQINTYTTSIQRDPIVALDADGDFVVVWQSNGVADLPSPFVLMDAMAPSSPAGVDADPDYGIAAARFQAQGGPLPTAVTLRAFGAEAVGGGWSALVAGVGAVVSAWWWRLRGKRSAG